jgi:S-DNA-T family DNA segregation ATPase FtsK/SpoIIIE
LSQATRKRADSIPLAGHVSRGLREGAVFVVAAVALYMLAALLSYTPADPGWSHSGGSKAVANLGGPAGAWMADILLYLFGLMAYLFPLMIAFIGWMIYNGKADPRQFDPWTAGLHAVGFILTLGAGTGLAAMHIVQPGLALPLNAGGVLGELISNKGLVSVFSFLGATLFLLALFFAGVTLFTGLSWFRLMDLTGRLTLDLIARVKTVSQQLADYAAGARARSQRSEVMIHQQERARHREPTRIEPVLRKPETSTRIDKERQVSMFATVDSTLPPLSLLDEPEDSGYRLSDDALQAMSRQVEMKLKDFGVDAEVVAVHPGPVITRFELQPAAGVKVNQIVNLSKDLARALSTISVRIVEVIPGKSVIGLEVPNEQREIVRLSEILRSKEYENADSPLALALGKDIGGYPVVVDLSRMPHLLVAGTTGSGKSVAVNAMVLSILYNASPNDVRIIMIDPKMLELSVYQGIPHLLTPVVTDMKEAVNALRWCVAEMDRRYRLMAHLKVRHLSTYNRKVKEAIDNKRPIPDPFFTAENEDDEVPILRPMPQIVIIIDELADMMMIVGKKVDELIARLAQKARAAGVHLILATQRPSVDVITGLIKANIPTRIAFQVSSKVDSRTILDQMGAEQLLGHGDMLYLPAGAGIPVRVHGAFVSDDEVLNVVSNLKSMGEPDYLDEILAEETGSGQAYGGDSMTADEDLDPLYDDAVRVVTETRRASISGVQRRLKIGYNRAARMVEEMERQGVVGALQPNGSREVLAPPPPSDD